MESNSYIIAKKMHTLRNPVSMIMYKKNIINKDLKDKDSFVLNAIRNWTYGLSRPRPVTVKKIAKLFKVDAVELMMNIQIWIDEDWEDNPKEYIYENIDSLD
jgi:hypothetical protein